MWKCLAFVVLALALLIGYMVNNALETMAYNKVYTFSPRDSCKLLDVPTPVEDLSDYNGSAAFGGGGDILGAFSNGSASVVNGAVWFINAAGAAQQVPISGESVPSKLVLHGIYYSKRSQRLYAVNHDEASGESVEVFDVKEGSALPQLVHRLTVRSPLFGNFALNDVVEGVGDEIYITEWRMWPFPPGGQVALKDADLMTRFMFGMMAPITLAKIPLTRVFRCSISASPQCTVASAQRFIGANGIAISADRQTIFVNDAPAQVIYVMGRQSDGSLQKVSQFQPTHIIDNLEMTEKGHLSAGTIPSLYCTDIVCHEAKELSASKTIDGREIGCGRCPGGLLEISLLGTGGKSFVDGTQTNTVMHDGSQLSCVSAALQIGEKFILGSPASRGVLYCSA